MLKHLIQILIPLLLISSAFACTCETIPTPTDSKNDPTIPIIFVGLATDIKQQGRDMIASFDVKKVIKGEQKDKLEIKTFADTALCGFVFEKNKYYLVYVYDGMRVQACSRTNLLADAKYDIKELNITDI
jgi:hypothetical protein